MKFFQAFVLVKYRKHTWKGCLFNMKKISFVVIACSFILAGCSDIIDAISGINLKANEAAEAISEDVHSLRNVKINVENQENVTVNNLIKAILRDVQWKHEKKDETEILIISGTWKEGLFEEYNFTPIEKEALKENGDVNIKLFFKNKQLQTDLTTVNLFNIHDNVIVDLHGKEAFNSIQTAYK